MGSKESSKRPESTEASESKNERLACEALEALPEEERIDLVTAQILNNPEILESPELKAVMVRRHTGPLPAPEDFRAYEKVLPGASDRIVAMAETSLAAQLKRMDISAEEMRLGFHEAARGQVYAFVLALVCLLIGGYLVQGGQQISGTIFGGVGLGAIIYTIIQGKRR
jgi:uncharacterized membrane protein